MNQLKQILGKYAGEITNSCNQEKYEGVNLKSFLLQKYDRQTDTPGVAIDHRLQGLEMVVSGNYIRISRDLSQHPAITIKTNNPGPESEHNPRSNYDSNVFASMAYLLCQNFIQIVVSAFVDKVLYIRYESEFEKIYSSAIEVSIAGTAQIDIVEEINSTSAINTVMDYNVGPTAKLRLHTFHNNSAGGNTILNRNVFLDNRASFQHGVMAHGAALVLDETRLFPKFRSNTAINGIVAAASKNYHGVLTVHPSIGEYKVAIEYRNIINDKSSATFYAGVAGQDVSERSHINVQDINLGSLPRGQELQELVNFIQDMLPVINIDNRSDTERFSVQKNNFRLF